MEEAEGAARRAHELAAEQGLPPPVEAAYALVQVGGDGDAGGNGWGGRV